MKGKFFLYMLVVLVTSAGCNLTVNVVDNPPPSPTRSQPIVEHPTNKPATSTPLPVAIQPTSQPTSAPTCTPRTDWPLYTVVTGDTLGKVAVRSGTSTAALIQANCLTNANLISVGQSLRVPRQPLPPTVVPPTAVPNPTVQQLGSIGISLYLGGDAGNFALPGGASETITWDGGPADAVRTDFFQRANNGTLTLISTDTNSTDGWSTTWLTPIGFNGELTAIATRPDGSIVNPAFKPSVSVLDPNAQSNAITLSTYLRLEGEMVILAPNQPEIISWKAAPLTATRIDFTFSPGDHSASRALGSVTPALGGTSITATFAAGDFGVLSAEAFLRNGTHLYFAKPITISAVAPAETTPEATAAQ